MFTQVHHARFQFFALGIGKWQNMLLVYFKEPVEEHS